MYDLSPSLTHARKRRPKFWSVIQTMMKDVQKDVDREFFDCRLQRKRLYYSKQVSKLGWWCLEYIVPAPRESLTWHCRSYSTAIGWPESRREVINDTTASLKGAPRALSRGMQSLCMVGNTVLRLSAPKARGRSWPGQGNGDDWFRK